MVLRKCTVCKKEKPASLEYFPPHKIGKYGLHSWCIPCKKAKDAARRKRPDQLARQKAWRDANKAKVKAYNKAYRDAGYRSTKHVFEWRNKDLEKSRKREREYQRSRREIPWYSLKTRFSSRISRMLKHGKQGKTTFEILGYTAEELKSHIEAQFTEGMSWENMGEWEVDHIIPVAHFKAETVDCEGFKKCWALSNLRPLWKSDNRSKGSRLDYEL